MIVSASVFVAAVVIGATTGPPTGSGNAVLLEILVAVLTGSAGSTLFNIWRHRAVGGQERDQLIAEASNAAVEGAKGMLEEYRRELDQAKKEILELKSQLEAAHRRIALLEGALAEAAGDRDRLQKELTDAIERRALMRDELDTLRNRVTELEQLLGGRLGDEHLPPD